MAEQSWRNLIAAERMRTDQEFAERVAASPLSNQQWSLVMTAVQFDVDGPEDPASARLVADTSRLPSVMDEIRRMGERGGGTIAPGGSGGTDDGGLLGGLKDALGLGSEDDELRETAEELTDEYATQLQARLEERDRWTDVCEAARAT